MRPRHYLLAASFALGLLLSASWIAAWPLLLLLVVPALSWSLYRGKRTLLLALACLGLGAFGLGWSQLRAPRPSTSDAARFAPQQQATITGRLLTDVQLKSSEAPATSDKTKPAAQRWMFDIAPLSLGQTRPAGLSGRMRVHLKSSKLPDLRIGDTIRLSGRLAIPEPARNFGAFSYREYLERQGIFSLLYARNLDKVGEGADWLPLRLLQGLRMKILAGFEAQLPLGQARLLGSLLLGAGASPVPAEIQERFQAGGLQHVLAVSGFQVQLVVLGMLALCQLLRLPRGLTCGLALAALWLFVALTGFPASVLRAGAIASLGLAGYLRFRSLDPLAGLTIGCSALLLLDPGLIHDIGFQFSSLATFGLVLSASWIQEKLHWLPLPVSGACAPVLAAQAWVLPAQLFHFGSLSWLFLPANLFAGLLTTALSWLAIAAALLGWLPPLQALVLWPAGWLCTIFLAGLDWLLKLPSPVLMLPNLATGLMLLAYAALLLKRYHQQRPVRMALVAALIAMPLLSGGLWLSDRRGCPLRVTFISVGQGDATLIEAGGKVVLVDAGPRWESDEGFSDAGEKDILPYLQQRGISRIDTAIVSHGHLDHYGGYFSLLEKLPIGRFVTVPGPGDSESYLELLSLIQKRNIPFELARNGSIEQLSPDVRLVFWQPLGDAQASINDQSLVVQVLHRDLSLLLSGDLEAEGEAALLTIPGFAARHTILKVPHHGSKTSSTPEFLARVMPREAIVSVGERNRYRHPSPEVMTRYAERGIRTWRTDRSGAVCLCSRGTDYELRTAVRP